MKSARRLCTYSGCFRLAPDDLEPSKCEQHRRQGHAGTSKNRPGDPFYSTPDWRRLRAARLAENPLCQCDQFTSTDAVVAADTVDHIKPRCDYPELELEYSNTRSMSTRHHNSHTARTRMDRSH